MWPATSGVDGVILLLLALASTPAVPDETLTPGVVRLHDAAQVCGISWGRDARHVSHSLKVKVCRAYGILKGCPGPSIEIDHRVSRELGGDDVEANLWPQPIREARRKDRLELALHRAVCRGELTLREAQRLIVDDWPGEYRRRFGVAP